MGVVSAESGETAEFHLRSKWEREKRSYNISDLYGSVIVITQPVYHLQKETLSQKDRDKASVLRWECVA